MCEATVKPGGAQWGDNLLNEGLYLKGLLDIKKRFREYLTEGVPQITVREYLDDAAREYLSEEKIRGVPDEGVPQIRLPSREYLIRRHAGST